MEPTHQPALQSCPGCAAMIDVSDQEPFEQVPCPVCETPMRARTQFNNFMLVDVLGAGGMGAVYRALDQTLNRYVALKVMRKEFGKDPAHMVQFEKEARITASVNHPNVVKVFSYGQDHGSFYIAMELVNKGSLDELMISQKLISEELALRTGIQMAQGLKAAQQLGLIHRDVKPGNILFADPRTAKMVDFGLAQVMEKKAESRGEVWGTPYYISPERLKNEPEDFRSDIYSLGATLFHAIAGKPPFESATLSVAALRQIKSKPVSLLAAAPDISSPTALVIDRMLKERPEDRFQSYDDLIELLTYASTKVAAAGFKERPVAAIKNAKKKSPLPRIALAAVLLAGAVLGYIFLKGEPNTPPPPSAQVTKEQLLLDKYSAARKQLIEGDYAAAAGSFSELQESPAIKPLMYRWVLFHKGLAQLLLEDYHESEATFSLLAQSGMYSDTPGEKNLASFFVETGAAAAQPVPAKIELKAQPTASEALALLVIGLKNCRVGNVEDAKTLLAAFISLTPEESFMPYAQIADFKKTGQKYLDECQPKKAPSDAETAETGTVGTAAAVAAPEAAQQLPEEPQPAEDSLLKAELESVGKAREKFLAEVAAYHFPAALKCVEALELKNPQALQKKEVLVKLANWLQEFKKTLVADLAREGFPFGIKRLNGSILEGGIGGASETEVNLKTPYGTIPIEWAQLSPDSILAMGSYFLKKEHDPAHSGERKWELGVYACQFGRSKVGRAILTELAQTKPEYTEPLEGILELSK